MDTEDHIQRAIDFGRRNKEALELIQNWCTNLRLVDYGGVGLVEAQTGLPIGTKRIECPHATQAGIASAHLEHLAVDFYDRHCQSCQHRVPVRMPNLLVLVERRDREVAAARERERAIEDQKNRELAERKSARDLLRGNLSAPGQGVLDLIDRVDSGAESEDARILIDTAHTAPHEFTESIREALVRLVDAGGQSRTATALETLRVLGFEQNRLVSCALRALARSEAAPIAGDIVAAGMTAEHAALTPPALPAIVDLASSERRFPFVSAESAPSDPRALLRVYEVCPEAVVEYLRALLCVSEKWPRILACDAIETIRQTRPAFGAEMAGALIESIGLPDDDYDMGAAAVRAARLLSRTFRYAAAEIDVLVQDALRSASGERQKRLFRVYTNSVGREVYHQEGPLTPGDAERLAFQRIMDLVTTRPDDDRFDDVLHFLRHDARKWPTLVDEHSVSLLGAAALIASDLDQPYSALLDPRPNALKALEAESRRMRLQYTLIALTELVGWAGARNPDTTGAQIVRDIDALPDGNDRLKAALVEALGEVGRNADGLPSILPALYGALTSRSQIVRAAAARAYKDIASELDDLDDLPPLLHETFLVLLGDPYLVVHKTAVHALQEVELPLRFCSRASSRLAHVINVYAESNDDDRFLADALQAFVYLTNRREKMTPALADQIIRVLDKMDPSSAVEVVDRCGRSLENAKAFPDFIVKLLCEASLTDYESERLAHFLWSLPRTELRRLAPQLESAVSVFRQRETDLTDDVIQLLSAIGAWPTVESIATRVVDALDDSRWNRWQRVQAELRRVAARVEMAASDGRLDVISELQKQWLTLLQTIKDYETREASE